MLKDKDIKKAVSLTRKTAYLICLITLTIPVHAQSTKQNTGADASQNASTDTEQTDAIQMPEILIEEQGEPESEYPLGIGMSAETMRTTPGSAGDPVRTLQSLPGMSFTDDSEPLPAVRGSRPDDNLFQTDFIPVSYLFHAGGIISIYNSDLVETFNIYPSAYGPEFVGASGGVFDVKLRDPNKENFRTTLDVSFLHAGMLFEGPISETQSFYLAGRFSYLDLLLEDQLEEEDGVTFYQFPKYTDYQGKYVWEASDKSTVRFQFNGASDEQDLNLSEEAEGIETDPILAGRIYTDTQFHEQAVVWDYDMANGMQLKSALSHSTDESKAEIGGAGELDLENESWRFKSHLLVPLNDKHDLSFGAQISEQRDDVDLTFGIPVCSEFEPDCRLTGQEQVSLDKVINSRLITGHIKDNWYVNDKLTIIPGLAFQQENYLDKQFAEPRLAMEYSWSDDLIFSAGTGIYHQFPGFLETTEEFGNPNLDYQRSVHGVLGVHKYFDNGIDIKTEVHYKKLDRLISVDANGEYANEGTGSAYGLDVLLRKSVTDKLSGWLSVSLSRARREDATTGKNYVFEYDQPVNINLVANYVFNKKWSVGAKYWVHSGAPYTPVLSATPDEEVEGLYNPEYGELNSARFPMFQRLDLRVDRTFKKSNGRSMGAYFELINALDTKNIASYEYNADYTTKERSEQIPQILALGFKATF